MVLCTSSNVDERGVQSREALIIDDLKKIQKFKCGDMVYRSTSVSKLLVSDLTHSSKIQFTVKFLTVKNVFESIKAIRGLETRSPFVDI